MNAKNMLFIASITFMCTQNMEAMHIIKAANPLARMQYARRISNQTKNKMAMAMLYASICSSIISTSIVLILEFGPKIDIAEEIEKRNNSKNNAE